MPKIILDLEKQLSDVEAADKEKEKRAAEAAQAAEAEKKEEKREEAK